MDAHGEQQEARYMQRGYVGKGNGQDAREVGKEKSYAEGQILLLLFEIRVAEAQENGVGDDAEGRERAK
jgi:hypothetical protein